MSADKKEKRKEQNRVYYERERHGGFFQRVRSCLYARKATAKTAGMTFEVEPVMFPETTHCPLLRSMEFCFTNDIISDNSLSIDRIDPRKGYTKDNTWVICQKANRIKNNATFEEFEEIYLNWKAELERERRKMTEENSSYALLFTMPDSGLQPERVLWLHVVAQAMIDAASRNNDIRQEVADWVDSEDFEIVCGMATLHIDHIRYAFKAILADKNLKRAFKRAMDFRFMVRTFVESHTGEIDKDRGA